MREDLRLNFRAAVAGSALALLSWLSAALMFVGVAAAEGIVDGRAGQACDIFVAVNGLALCVQWMVCVERPERSVHFMRAQRRTYLTVTIAGAALVVLAMTPVLVTPPAVLLVLLPASTMAAVPEYRRVRG